MPASGESSSRTATPAMSAAQLDAANGLALGPHRSTDEIVGTVGSPSTTAKVTVDVVAGATNSALLGELVTLAHPLADGRHLLALGTVSDIETRNRWHEDPNMRGVVKLHGSLPHLSAVGDTRTASVVVQAVYTTDASAPPFASLPIESGGALGMSPTTGEPVRRVDNTMVEALVARHRDEVVYLGRVYRTSVRLPLFIRDFASDKTDGAFHVGVFGRNGSGKTALAVYMLAAQMRHLNMGVLAFDPQGQFASQTGFPFDLQAWARSLGRPVQVLSIASSLRLPRYHKSFAEYLAGAMFFDRLTIKTVPNKESAIEEFSRLIQASEGWNDREPDDLLRELLAALEHDEAALIRIFSSKAPRDRLLKALQQAQADDAQFGMLARIFRQVHTLFAPRNLTGHPRQSLEELIDRMVGGQRAGGRAAPYAVIDLSSQSGMDWLDDSETKARLIHMIAGLLRRRAETVWQATRKPINCGVVFDEAHRFAAASPEGEQTGVLAGRLVEYVRTTRKYGLGWMFITQEISSLAQPIYTQLRIRAFGYGLTTGTDLTRLTDEVGRGPSLELYKSFADPRALSEKTYPFMITGPASPLSFTAAPVFLEVHTDVSDFLEQNRHLFPRVGVPPAPHG